MATATQHQERTGITHDACCHPTLESLEHTVAAARRIVTDTTKSTVAIAHDTAERVRRHPLPAVALATAAGLLAGGLAAITLVALQQQRRR